MRYLPLLLLVACGSPTTSPNPSDLSAAVMPDGVTPPIWHSPIWVDMSSRPDLATAPEMATCSVYTGDDCVSSSQCCAVNPAGSTPQPPTCGGKCCSNWTTPVGCASGVKTCSLCAYFVQATCTPCQ